MFFNVYFIFLKQNILVGEIDEAYSSSPMFLFRRNQTK